MKIKVERFVRKAKDGVCNCEQCYKPSNAVTCITIGGHHGKSFFLCDACLEDLISKARRVQNEG